MATEYAKVANARERGSETVGDFLEWLQERGWTICEPNPNSYEHPWKPVGYSIERLLAAYFGVDLQKLDQEKRATLDRLRFEEARR